MPKPDIKLVRVRPGFLAYYTLDELTRRQKNTDPREWGICGAKGYFWLSKRTIQFGEDVLRLPLSDILDKRNKMYPNLADGKIYIFVGTNRESGKFEWFLLNEEEAMSRIAPGPDAREKELIAGAEPVVHQVLLADLNSLAELWEVSSDNLGLEINADGELVPRAIGGDDDLMSFSNIQGLADKYFPWRSALDLVVQVQATSEGSSINISTTDTVFSAEGRKIKSRWWAFTDSYKEQMDS